MSTIDTGIDMIKRNRKRPKNGDAITKRTWGEAFEKELEIPRFIDSYNHHMNSVDLADQGRAECPMKRRTSLTWKPCFSLMFDTTICNMARLYEACGHHNHRYKKGLNSIFRRLLASKLMTKVAARAYTMTPGIKVAQCCQMWLLIVASPLKLVLRLALKIVRPVGMSNIMVS